MFVLLSILYGYLTDACHQEASARRTAPRAGRPTFYQTASPESRSRRQLRDTRTVLTDMVPKGCVGIGPVFRAWSAKSLSRSSPGARSPRAHAPPHLPLTARCKPSQGTGRVARSNIHGHMALRANSSSVSSTANVE